MNALIPRDGQARLSRAYDYALAALLFVAMLVLAILCGFIGVAAGELL